MLQKRPFLTYQDSTTRLKGSAILGLALTLIPTQPFASEAFTSLFARTCMQHFYSPSNLESELKSLGASELTGKQAKYYLDGQKGIAWTVRETGRDYVVALIKKNYSCIVFAQRISVAEVKNAFVSAVASAPPPYTSTQVPTANAEFDIAYFWSSPNKAVGQIFTLNISPEKNPTVQAIASVSLAK